MKVSNSNNSKNHNNPYSGIVIAPKTPRDAKITCSVVEAAKVRGLPQIIHRYGEWAVCKDGVYNLRQKYHIRRNRINEEDQVEHVAAKPWVTAADFENAIKAARRLYIEDRAF